MGLEVKTFDEDYLNEELFRSRRIVKKYVTELKRTLDNQVSITSKALTKIKQLEKRDCKYCPHNEGGCGYYTKALEE